MPRTTASKALLELNDLVLLKYGSVYGYAFEVLTLDGRNRIAHGNNEEEVLNKAVEYLEAKAVLSGKQMVEPGGNYTSGAANTGHELDAMRYVAIERADLEKMKLKYLKMEQKQRVQHLSQFLAYDSNSPTGTVVLEYGKGSRGPVPGPEPEEKV